MRRIAAQQCTYSHLISNPIPISPLSIAPLLDSRNKCHFSTNKRPSKSKIKIAEDEFDEANTKLQEATVTKQKTNTTFRQTASKTISNIQFSDDEAEEKTYRSRLEKWIAIHLFGLDNILPRMIALRDKNPEAITKTMNSFGIFNAFTGVVFGGICWQCSSYIVHPELIPIYLAFRLTSRSSKINHKVSELLKLKYPLLKQCKWSRKAPDPMRQNADDQAQYLAAKIPILQRVQSFVADDGSKISKLMRKLRDKTYSSPIEHGFAWDIANNCRVLIGIPLSFALLHAGGAGLYITDLDIINPMFVQWFCVYVGGSYGARLCANWSMRTVVLTTIEKSYGLRSESGEYYGYTKNDTKRKGAVESTDEAAEVVNSAKVSKRKPTKK